MEWWKIVFLVVLGLVALVVVCGFVAPPRGGSSADDSLSRGPSERMVSPPVGALPPEGPAQSARDEVTDPSPWTDFFQFGPPYDSWGSSPGAASGNAPASGGSPSGAPPLPLPSTPPDPVNARRPVSSRSPAGPSRPPDESRTQLRPSERPKSARPPLHRTTAYYGLEEPTCVPPPANRDLTRLQFNASYPSVMDAAFGGVIAVHVFGPTQRDAVEARIHGIQSFLGDFPGRASAVAAATTATGRTLTIRPLLTNLRASPAAREVVWNGDLIEAVFNVAPAQRGPGAQDSRGVIDISVGGLTIAQIPLSIRIEMQPTISPPATAQGKVLDSIFASYSHLDEAVVNRFASAYRGLGIDLFVDHRSLRSGQDWRSAVRSSIGERDLFQLFWSPNAAASAEVEAEWRYALEEVVPLRPAGVDFIRPVYWSQPLPAAPTSLRGLHFAYVAPADLGVAPE